MEVLMESINQWVIGAAGEWWVLPALFLLCIIDGFFPPVPSESVVVALAAIAISAGQPNLIVVMVLAAAGAIIGDNIAYQIGRRIGVNRFRWMRTPRVARALVHARSQMDKRGGALLLTARYIPIGRVAVNMTAGATGYSRRRFIVFDTIAGISWSLYSVMIGVVAGNFFHSHPLAGALVGVLIAVMLGVVLDWTTKLVQRRKAARRHPQPAPTAAKERVSDAAPLG